MCFIIADQMPSTLSNVFPANCNTLICLRLKFRKDMNYASDFLHIDEKNFLGNLEVGQAIVKKKTLCPFLSKITPFANKTENITDEEIRRRYLKDSRYSARFHEDPEKRSDNQTLFASDNRTKRNQRLMLINISKNKFTGTSSHYKRLNISTRKGNEAKENLKKKGLIKIKNLYLKNGGSKSIMILTRKGVEYLHDMGFEVEYDTLQEGVDHKNAKFKAVKTLLDTGKFKEIKKEVALSNGHFADILAVDNTGKKFAVEVETGKSDWKKNIDKCLSAGISVVSLLVADFQKGNEMKKYIEGKEARVVVCKGSRWLI